jgi:CubicO group peptidase (beta-lactamase class C family)
LAGHDRVAPAGARFNYNTAETHMLGGVLRSAIGNSLSKYLANEIWQPFGMEHDANWLISSRDRDR